mmetsp:Transcript_10016/g.15141  ORF Transcript_10016/g.15141 Transcript_10016/m.15141 type:complete len:798 (-) Transcript_10016:104-2497(-)|eukprot:CAMPEP_0185034948 /NCGR_PEP_ID=MMETSP1103-20130426/25448_1 /TAXON_ID=36769 /ORGANISM="Paraphysomonas bandaiensis, Strain Caron Lab Isolate" /LENGTH=797 /DNA_ID=CAMNT_0027571809 /DNA_START=30 /DNA_END=2423 /DNA_ORIENTATION=-
MKRNAVKVCVRTRPTHHFAQDNITIVEDQNIIQINQNNDEDNSGMLNNRQNSFKFKLDHIFHNASQSTIYDMFARDTVQGVIDGINGAILSYGQTGSGKTFTMMGDTHSYEHRGVAPRALGQLFSEINSRVEYEYRVSCTYLELYGEKVYDLLKDLSNRDQGGEYTIAEEKDGRGVHVRGLNEVEIFNESEALNLLFSGELARTTAQHKLNRRSNRSHSIFTVYVQQRQKSGINERVIHSKLHLVDLAGSERLKKTLDHPDGRGFDEVTRKESMSINQSLTYLEQCVVALARRSHHIPYRQSKLTTILKDALGSNCNTLMIACIWGESDHLEETISTLRLASRMMRVQNETSTVETVDSQALIRKQAKLIKALKQELLMHDALVERAGVGYEPYTPEQQASIRQMLESYVESSEVEEEDMLNIDSFRKMLEVCKQFKKMILASREETRLAKEEAFANYNDNGFYGRPGGSRPVSGGSEFLNSTGEFNSGESGGGMDGSGTSAQYVGEEDDDPHSRTGFALGVAAADSVPAGLVDTGMRAESKVTEPQSTSSPTAKQASKRVEFSEEESTGAESPSRRGADGKSARTIDAFARTDGEKLYNRLLSTKQALKELKAKSRECTQSVNSAKQSIDILQAKLTETKNARVELLKSSGIKVSDADEIIDEDEFALMKELKEAKRTYKNGYEQLLKVKSALHKAQEAAEDARDTFAEEFAMWNMGYGGSRTMETFDFKDDAKNGIPDESDQLDDQEAFERLEVERVVSKDPDSLAFFHAQKTRRAHMTQNGSTIRQIHKSKRLA